jgi:hypothetical protein
MRISTDASRMVWGALAGSGAGATVELPSISCRLLLAAVYEKVNFAA